MNVQRSGAPVATVIIHPDVRSRLRRGAVRPPGDRWLAGGRNSSRRHRWWRGRCAWVFPRRPAPATPAASVLAPRRRARGILFGMKRSWTTFSSARVSAAARSPTMTICFWLECAKSIAASSCGKRRGRSCKPHRQARNVASARSRNCVRPVNCHSRSRFIAETELADGSSPSYSSFARTSTCGASARVEK